MKQYIYKVIVTLIAVVLLYEFTVGKLVKKYTDKLNFISTKEGRKELVISLKDEIRKGVKKEFIGGCDIVKEMYESGELKKVFDDKGINYKK